MFLGFKNSEWRVLSQIYVQYDYKMHRVALKCKIRMHLLLEFGHKTKKTKTTYRQSLSVIIPKKGT